MNTTFERSSNSTDEWYTPKEIIDALGEFDLDPCAPVAPYKTVGIISHHIRIKKITHNFSLSLEFY